MDLDEITKRFPDIELNELLSFFPEIPMSDYPGLSGYTRDDVYAGAMAPGGLFLAFDMAEKMNLEEGMRVLDLGPGNCASSMFLAKRYAVQVFAAEHWVDPSENWRRIESAGLADSVVPLKMDARLLPFAEGYFDAVFSLDAFAYFMTDDLYPSYLAGFVRQGGNLCIGGHCFTQELTPETPREFLWEMAHAYHSPAWWRNHFEKADLWEVTFCEEHPRGRAFWLDDIRRNIEACHPRDMNETQRADILHSIVMLLSDKSGLVSHFILAAKRK